MQKRHDLQRKAGQHLIAADGGDGTHEAFQHEESEQDRHRLDQVLEHENAAHDLLRALKGSEAAMGLDDNMVLVPLWGLCDLVVYQFEF